MARNVNEAMVVSNESAFGWNVESRLRQAVLYWCILQELGFSHHEDVFRFNLLYTEIL